MGGKHVKLQIWDTAGQERFRSVTRSYYRGAAGSILVYDISSRESYNHVSSWLADARSLANPDIVIIMVGNKTDLEEEREVCLPFKYLITSGTSSLLIFSLWLKVTFLEASRFSQENDLMFLETSALTGQGVEEVFLKCARTILNKIETGKLGNRRA